MHNLYATPGTSWNHVDMTAQAGGSNAPAANSLTSFDNFQGNSLNLFYVGTDQHVHNLYASPGTNWSHVDMTPQAGGPGAGAGLSSWVGSGVSLIIGGRITSGGSGLPGAAVTLGGTVSMTATSDAGGNYSFVLPAGGTYTVSPSASGYTFSPAAQAFSNAVSNRGSQTASFANVGTVTVNNLTHASWGSSFAVGDTLQISIAKAVPNQNVSVAMSGAANGTMQMGQTDGNGNFTNTAVEQASGVGSFTEIWSVGGVASTPAVSFLVGQLNSGGTITTTDAGQTSDGNLQGVSMLSITNGVVSTYSATSLDYAASLYYDTNTVATLFDNGTSIKQSVTGVTTNTTTALTATANAWDDYDLQTDHYAVAFYLSGSSYANPYHWGDSCYAETGDCTIGAGGGFAYWVTVASIYVGSTLADQTFVPQNGTLPNFDTAYTAFSSAASPQYPTGTFTLNVTQWIKALSAAYFAVQVVYGETNKNSYPPIPFFVDLDREIYDIGTTERQRTFRIKDSYGRQWNNSYPVRIRERFTNMTTGGGASAPASNGTWSLLVPPDVTAPNPPDKAIDINTDYEFTDHHKGTPLNVAAQTNYLQYHYATNFTLPPVALGLTPYFIVPDVSGAAIPLWIRDSINKCSPFHSLAAEGISTAGQNVYIDGDAGVGQACRH